MSKRTICSVCKGEDFTNLPVIVSAEYNIFTRQTDFEHGHFFACNECGTVRVIPISDYEEDG